MKRLSLAIAAMMTLALFAGCKEAQMKDCLDQCNQKNAKIRESHKRYLRECRQLERLAKTREEGAARAAGEGRYEVTEKYLKDQRRVSMEAASCEDQAHKNILIKFGRTETDCQQACRR